MTRLLALVVAGATALGLPVPAHADGPGWVGTCRVEVTDDPTAEGTLGGPGVWNGEVNLAVAASTTGATISAASCTVRVNGGGVSTILTASALGPVAVGAGRATFSAQTYDTVEICTHVTTSSNGANSNCAIISLTSLCPDQVCGPGGLLDQVEAVVQEVLYLIGRLPGDVSQAVNDAVEQAMALVQDATELIESLRGMVQPTIDGAVQQAMALIQEATDEISTITEGLTEPPCPVVAGAVVCASFTAGSVIDEYTVNRPTEAETHIAGSIDRYRFTLPNGGIITVPCVVLGGASAVDPCRTAGGTWVDRMLTLYDEPADVPTSELTTPLVRVCNATLVLTVDDNGVNSFPAYTVC